MTTQREINIISIARDAIAERCDDNIGTIVSCSDKIRYGVLSNDKYYFLVEDLMNAYHQVCPQCSSDNEELPCYCELWEAERSKALFELKKYHNETRKEIEERVKAHQS